MHRGSPRLEESGVRDPASRLAVALLVFVGVVLMAVTVGFVGNAAAADTGPDCSTVSYNGSGTSSDPYEVATLDQLQCLGENHQNASSPSDALSSDYELVNDIDASTTADWNGGTGFDPIGRCALFRSNQNDMCQDNSDAFSGVFDGNGNEIGNLVIDRPDGNSVGLFGYTDSATVRNVRLQNVTVRADQRVGGLIGAQLYGVVENASVDGRVEGGVVSPGQQPDGFRVGGIVGMGIRGAVLTNQNVFTGTVIGGSNVGGIIGRTGGSTAVSVTYSRANVTATADRCSVCTNTNSPGGPNAGGIAGNSGNPSKIENSYAAGNVSGSTVGGIVGGDNSGTDTFVNVYWDRDLGPNQGTGADYSSSTTNFTGLTTAEMQGAAARENMGGFDFESQWAAPTGTSPVFTWQLSAADDPDDFFFGDIDAVAGDGEIVVSATDGGVGVPGEIIVVLDGGDIDSLDGLDAGDTATTDENGDATFSFTEETAGTYVIAVETEGGQASDTAEVVVEAAAPSDEGNGEFTATIDGTLGEQGTANVTVRDEFGNPAAGETVTVTDAGGLTTIPSSATVGSDGNATFTFDVIDRDQYTVTFGLQGGSLSDTATFDTTCDTVTYETVGGVKQVDSPATLQCMDADLDADYELTRDLNLTAANVDSWDGGKGFAPIGGAGNEFTGTFDGEDHTVSGLTIDRGSTEYVGLFGRVDSPGGVRDVGLEGGSITGKTYVGGLIGYLDTGTVSGAYTTTSVTGDTSGHGFMPPTPGSHVGGLVGYLGQGSVSDAYATGAVSGAEEVGGLVGSNEGTVTTSRATGSVDATGYVGGLVGSNRGTVSESYANGSVTLSGALDGVGGLVGFNDGTVTSTYAAGSVEGGDDFVGGLVGLNYDTIETSYATGSVTGDQYLGGLVGLNDGGSVATSYWDTVSSGRSSSAEAGSGSAGLTTSEMQNTSASTNMAGFDFTKTWGTVVQGGDASADGYPILRAIDRPEQLTVQGIYDPPPTVDSIARASTSPTDASSVDFDVNFSESVTGVDASDYTLSTTGTSTTANGGADIAVSGGPTSYTVTVANVEGTGTLRLDVEDDDTIEATSNDVALAGVYPATDGSYTDGEAYTVDNAAPSLTDDSGTTAETTRLTIVDDLTANDADDTTLTVSAVGGQPSKVGTAVAGSTGGRFTITSDGQVSFDPDGDFESLSAGDSDTSEVSVTVSDALGTTATQTVTATITGVNDAPTDLSLSSNSIAQSDGTDALVGTLSSTDRDDDSATYSLVSGTGDADNGAFSLDGSDLRATDAASLEAGDYAVRLQASDGNGGTTETAFTVSVTDDRAPTIASSTPADDATDVANTSDIDITFSEDVQFGSGTVTLRKDDGGFSDVETFDVGSDTGTGDGTVSITGDTLTINATDDFSLETAYAVRIDAGALIDTATTPYGFDGIDDDSTLNFTTGETTPPTISGVSVSNPADRQVTVSFDADERLTTITVGISGAESATLTRGDFSESGSGPYTYTATYDGSTDGTYTATLNTALDSGGNDGASGQTGSVDVSTGGGSDDTGGSGGGSDTTDPTADAGPNRTVTLGESVTLDGSASSDNDEIVSYEWDLDDGTTTSGVQATHTYTDSGTYEVDLTVTDDAENTDIDSLIVTVRPIEPTLSVDPDEVAFGDVALGENRTRTVELTAGGDGSISLQNVSVLGAAADQFEVVSAPSTVGTGEPVPLTVRFAPTEPGNQTATIRFETGDGATVGTVPVSGVGVGPVVVLSGSPGEFDGVSVDAVTTGTIIVRNTGTDVLTVEEVTTSGTDAEAFVVRSAPDELAPGATGEITVAFDPTTEGELSATLELTSNAVVSPATVPLEGTAAAAAIGVSSRSLSFEDVAVGETGSLSVEVTNLATSQILSVEETIVTGSNPGPFAVVNGDAPFTIAPGESRTITVSYSPTDAEEETAQLQILSDAGNDPQITVWLSSSDTYVLVQQVAIDRAGTGTMVSVQGRNVKQGARISVNVSQPSTRAQPSSFDVLGMTVRNQSNFDINVTQGARPLSEGSAVYANEGRRVVQYVELQHSVESDTTYDDTEVTFRVRRSALPEGTSPDGVTLTRYSDGEWSEMPLELIGESPRYYRYRAATPGFSQFVISVPDQRDESRAGETTDDSSERVEPQPNVDIRETPRAATDGEGAVGGGLPLHLFGLGGVVALTVLAVFRFRRNDED